MSKFMTNMVVLAGLQSALGIAAAMTGANAILCRGAQPRPVVAASEERNNIKPYFGHSGSVITSVYSEVDFEVEFATSGSKGVAPKWGNLMRACAMSETITPTTSVVYAPITNGQEQITLDIFIDGIRHRMLDAKGTVSFEMKSKSTSLLKFKFTGLYVKAVDAAMPTGVNYSAFTDPLPVNFENTPTWSLHGQTGALDSMSFDLANQVSYRNLVGEQGIQITERKPTGSVSLEMGSIATKDWFDAVIKADLGLARIVHGKADGFVIEINAPKTQLSDPAYSDAEGVAVIGMKTIFKPNLGNDELTITLR